jgi:hypothetical protein
MFEGRFMVREPDFGTRLDVLLTKQEIGDQTSVRAVQFFAYCVVAWFAAVVDQLQAPRAGIPKPRRAVYEQLVFEINLSLIHRVVQRLLFS